MKSKSDNCESIDADRVRSKGSEKVAEVGSECDKPGGVSEPGVMTWFEVEVVFSVSFFRLMIILILSFWTRRWSLLLHHMGLLYSHRSPRCLQAVQAGEPSSHFFLRSLHV